MESNKDLYNILELDRNCTQDEIKKSYKKLVLKYHPDRCELPNAQEKFIDIRYAYEILSKPLERNKYDQLNFNQQIEFYDNLKNYIKTKIPNIDEYIKLFFDNEDHLKNYVENMDILTIYNKILEKIPNINIYDLPYIEDINIYGKLITTFEERYLDKYRKIQVNRQTKPPITFCIPLRNSKIIIPKEGEYDYINNKDGDIIIDIEIDNQTNKYKDFIQMDKDVYLTKYISLYEYLYGGEFKQEYVDGEINVKFDSFVEKFPLITIENKGMLESKLHYTQDMYLNNTLRGNLLIIIKIENLENLKNCIKKL